jgi:hypothetical protein
MACKWINICPLRRFEKQGRLGKEWRTHYCEHDYTACRRFQLEEKGIFHPDTMLPDGTIDNNLT